MQDYTPAFESENFYHIYSHAVGSDNLFKEDSNYDFFLSRFSKYINPVADTFAYCLMPNHFHFLIRLKNENEINTVMQTVKSSGKKLNYEKFVSKQFSNLFSSYTQSYNKQQNRKGNLFQKPFKRKHIRKDKYILNLIRYIHNNPVHHKFTDNFRSWKYSSYTGLLSDKKTNLMRNEVIEIFDGKDNFIYFHNAISEDEQFEYFED